MWVRCADLRLLREIAAQVNKWWVVACCWCCCVSGGALPRTVSEALGLRGDHSACGGGGKWHVHRRGAHDTSLRRGTLRVFDARRSVRARAARDEGGRPALSPRPTTPTPQHSAREKDGDAASAVVVVVVHRDAHFFRGGAAAAPRRIRRRRRRRRRRAGARKRAARAPSARRVRVRGVGLVVALLMIRQQRLEMACHIRIGSLHN